MRVLAFAALAFIVSGSTVLAEDVGECDRLASSAFDQLAITEPVAFEAIDTDKAIPACRDEIAADPENLRLQFQLARALESSGADAEAFVAFLAAAEAGYPAAMNGVGRMYRRGGGTATDIGAAIKWFGMSALRGDPAAATNLADIYYFGTETIEDPASAFMWYNMAAEAGNANAEANIGHAYAQGRGVAQDYVQARHWFERAAARGNLNAKQNLGYIYELGLGIEADPAKAASYYYDAIAGGDMPTLEYFSTYPMDTTREVWRAIEGLLVKRGTADVAIDGRPDRMTVEALAILAGVDPKPALAAFAEATAGGAMSTPK